MTELLDRFLKYVKIDTQSAYGQAAVPSTEKQRDLAAVLADELRALGTECAVVSESGCVYGKIPANCEGAPSIGFSAHLDTSPDLSGKDVKPRIVKNYDGGDVTLNEELGVVLSPENFPHMKNYKGWDLVVTDGTTLLGADDKAGLAEIMTMAQYFHDNPGEKHGEIQFFFPTDEEIGCLGAKTLDKNLFNPKFAYTLDGGPLGEITYETFNAAAARVDVTGVNIHPGLSKNQMINAILIANEFINMLPPAETPSHTEGYEGYYHVLEASGEVELATLRLLLRDHDAEKLEARKQRLRDIAEFLNKVYGEGRVTVEIEDTYRNIGEAIKPCFEIVEAIDAAMKAEGVAPFYTPMRGGTDGTILSFEGIPCPNICTGGHNFHGRYEYVPVQSMEKIANILIGIVKSFAK